MQMCLALGTNFCYHFGLYHHVIPISMFEPLAPPHQVRDRGAAKTTVTVLARYNAICAIGVALRGFGVAHGISYSLCPSIRRRWCIICQVCARSEPQILVVVPLNMDCARIWRLLIGGFI